MSRNPCLADRNQSNQVDILHDIEVAGYRYVILTICMFGIICNILNLCVLLQRRLKESPYTYLTGLAIADMLTLVFISPFTVVRGDYLRHETTFYMLVRFESQFYMPLANYFGQVSIMITLALTIERYLFTTYPLRTRSFCKARYARVTIVIIVLLCALLSFPRFLLETVKNIIGPVGSFNSSQCSTHPFVIQFSSTSISHLGQCFCVIVYPREIFKPYRAAYYISMFVLNQILPVIVLLYLNLKLIRRVQYSNRYTLGELVARQHMSTQTNSSTSMMVHPIRQKRIRDEHRLTKTLVAIVLVFLVCNTFTIVSYPDLVRKITHKKYPDYIYVGFRIQKLVTNIMLLTNYSINFFFYCAFNQKFLNTLRLTFRHGICSYFHDHLQQPAESLAAQRALCNGTVSATHSSCYLQSKILNPNKKFSMYDEGFQPLKQTRRQFSLKALKTSDHSH